MKPEQNILAQLKRAAAFVMDVDGVLTDGSLLVTENGEQLRTMNIRDGYALHRAVENWISVCVITGGNSEGVRKRLNGLGVRDVFMNASDKKNKLLEWAKGNRIDLATTIYIGDDIPDLEAMQLCGIPCCPADAADEIIKAAVYVSPCNGGKGCVRDIIEKVLKLQGKW